MKKNSIIIIVVVLLAVVVMFFVLKGSGKKEENNLTAPITQNSTGAQLFSSSPMAQYAYLISGPTLDSKAEEATMGFTITKKALPDGSMQITLNSQNAEYKTQTYTVKAGEKLYFVEKFLADDSENADKNLKDDTAILVDANGYIVAQ
ncbi:MAG: hypothetical protein KGL67_01955 [Patescibacteria group bacterium]|nr:hypothetical protein [Patescibacteria group bacterium]